MSSYVIYKLKNSNTIKTINFHGSYISKKEAISIIKEKENYGYDELKVTEYEGREYVKDFDRIPKYTTIEISRLPMINGKKAPKTSKIEFQNERECKDKSQLFPSIVEDIDEEMLADDEKLKRKIDKETSRMPIGMMKPRNPPSGYVCYKCNIPGHYIEHCPGIKDQFGNYVDRKAWKQPSGIPRTRLEVAEPTSEGVFLDNEGRYVRFAKGEQNVHIIPQKVPFSAEENPKFHDIKAVIPPEFNCNLCNNAILNASQTPCCKKNYCTACIANKLFDPEIGTNGICPSCSKPLPLIDMLIENTALDSAIYFWKDSLRTEKRIDENVCSKSDKKEEVKEIERFSDASSDDKELDIVTNDPNFVPSVPMYDNRYQRKGFRPCRTALGKTTPLPVEEYSLSDFNENDEAFKMMRGTTSVEKGDISENQENVPLKSNIEIDILDRQLRLEKDLEKEGQNLEYEPTRCGMLDTEIVGSNKTEVENMVKNLDKEICQMNLKGRESKQQYQESRNPISGRKRKASTEFKKNVIAETCKGISDKDGNQFDKRRRCDVREERIETHRTERKEEKSKPIRRKEEGLELYNRPQRNQRNKYDEGEIQYHTKERQTPVATKRKCGYYDDGGREIKKRDLRGHQLQHFEEDRKSINPRGREETYDGARYNQYRRKEGESNAFRDGNYTTRDRDDYRYRDDARNFINRHRDTRDERNDIYETRPRCNIDYSKGNNTRRR